MQMIGLLVMALAVVPGEGELKAKLPEIFSRSAEHYRALDAVATPLMKDEKGEARIVRGLKDMKTRELNMQNVYDWTSGFYPGSLWYLFEATGDTFFRDRATAWTEILAPVAKYDKNHDTGFMMYCSYGNARRILNTKRYDALLIETAKSLCHRYHEGLGLIRSWGAVDGKKDFLVIPDNMMNLELLEWASKNGGGKTLDKIARSHSDVTRLHHFRPDGSAYHVLDYNQETKRVQGVKCGQGASTETAWSRGQSWAIYGYTMMFRETCDLSYRVFAEKLADYALNHPNMPADGVPYWDYGAPGEERDTAAAAVLASALLELSEQVGGAKGTAYRAFAVKQLLSLASPAYFSEGDEIGHFLLKHGMGYKFGKMEFDSPLNYGDYYFLEALLRFRRSCESDPYAARKVPLEGTNVTVADLVARAKASPCLAVTPKRVEGIRAELKADPELAKWWKTHLAWLDKVLRSPVDIPDRGGQWCHYFYCRKCAAALKSESPTRHVCTNCGEVHEGWPFDDVYIMHVHNENASHIFELGAAYRITGERRYAERVRELLLGYAKTYPTYKVHTIDGGENLSGGRIGPQTLEESSWLCNLCKGYDMISDVLTDAEKETIKSNVLLPSGRLILRFDKGIGNWQCWHLSAFGLAGLVCGDTRLVAEAATGKNSYIEQLRQGVFDDGIWNECAWGYQFYMMDGLANFVTALDNLGLRPPARFKTLFDSPFGQVQPDWNFPALNDSGLHPFRHHVPSYQAAWTWWKDPTYAWWLSQNKSTRTVGGLLGGSPLSGDWTPPALSSKLYADSGLAVMRSNPAGVADLMPVNYVAIDFGAHGGWHGHPDKLDIMLFSRGELLAEDPGSVGYSNARQWGWYRATLAHNTLVKDGVNQAFATGACEAFATKGNATVTSALAGEAYGDSKVGRLTALVGDVVLDYAWVKDSAKHDWEWAFHSRGKLSTPLALKPVQMPPLKRLDVGKKSAGMDINNDGSEAWGWTRETAEGPQPGTWQATWTCGKATLNLFQRSPAGTVRTGKGSAQPASKEFTLAVNRLSQAQSPVFATVMTLDGTTDVTIDEIIADANGAEGFIATIGGRKYTILRSPSDDCRGRKARAAVIVTGTDVSQELELLASTRK